MLHQLFSGRYGRSIGYCLIAVFLDSKFAAADQTIPSSTCPVVWAQVVEKIALARRKLPENANVILFSGPDGRVFNCLDESISERDMKKITFFNKAFISAMAQNQLENPAVKTLYCDHSFFSHEKSSVQYMFHLPYDIFELNSKTCKRRLNIYLKVLGDN